MTTSKSSEKQRLFVIEELEIIRDGLSSASDVLEKEAKALVRKGRSKTAQYLRELRAANNDVLLRVEQAISAEQKEKGESELSRPPQEA